MATTEVVKYDVVDPADVPSVNFAPKLSGEHPRAFHIVGLLIAAFLLLMLRGNQMGKDEDIYLVGFAIAVLGFVANDYFGRRSGRIR